MSRIDKSIMKNRLFLVPSLLCWSTYAGISFLLAWRRASLIQAVTKSRPGQWKYYAAKSLSSPFTFVYPNQ